LVAFLSASCAGETGSPEARVVTQDFVVHGDRVGAGATVVLDGPQTLRDIELQIRFFTDDAVIRTEREELPSCFALCHWASSYIMESAEERSINRIDVTIEDTGPERGAELQFLVSRARGNRIETQLNGKRGRASIIALRSGRPFFGVGFETQEGERQKLRMPAGDFPEHDGLFTVFYPGEGAGAGAPGAD